MCTFPVTKGDRLDTDIALGKLAHWKTLLVMTGVTDEKVLSVTEEGDKPEYVMGSFGMFASEF